MTAGITTHLYGGVSQCWTVGEADARQWEIAMRYPDATVRRIDPWTVAFSNFPPEGTVGWSMCAPVR